MQTKIIATVLITAIISVGVWAGVYWHTDQQYATALNHPVDHYACIDVQGGTASANVIHSLPADAASRYYACYAYDAKGEMLERHQAPHGLVSYMDVTPKGRPPVSVL